MNPIMETNELKGVKDEDVAEKKRVSGAAVAPSAQEAQDAQTVTSAAVLGQLALTHSAFRDMALSLYWKIRPLKQEYEGILCPLRGGFYLSDFLSRRLELPVQYIHIASYKGFASGDFVVHFQPQLLAGKRYLICDDILATGRTMAKIEELFPASRFDGAFLYRHKQRALPFERTLFAREVDESVWVRFPWEDESTDFCRPC